MKSNLFAGMNLAEAVRKATVAYDRRMPCAFKNQRRCNDLLREISFLQNDARSLADETERLEREAERLKRSAAIDLAVSAITALTLLGAAARGVFRAYRKLQRKRAQDLTANDIIDLLAALSPLASAGIAVEAINDLRESEDLARKAETLERRSDLLARGLEEAVKEYQRFGCGEAIGVGS